MSFYSVTLPAGTEGAPRPNGYNTQVVFAPTAALALVAAKALYSYDTDAAWGAATAVELAATNTMEGLELRITYTGNVDAYRRTVSYIGIAGDTLALFAEGVKLALVADNTNIPTDATRSGFVITIPAANNLGDLEILAAFYMNGVLLSGGPVATVSATGAEASARTITLSGGTMEGSRLRVTIADPTNPMDLSVFLHDGETIDLAAARLVVLMDAHALIGGGGKVTYASNVITIAGATAAQGAKVITCTWTRDGGAVPELAVTVNAAGVSSANRTLTMAADGVLPCPVIARSILAAKQYA